MALIDLFFKDLNPKIHDQDYILEKLLLKYSSVYEQIMFGYYDGSVVDNNKAMFYAAYGGCKNLVDYFISKGACDWNWGMRCAAEGGYKELVDYFITLGANNWEIGMQGAAEGGYYTLVDYFITLGANDWNKGLCMAAYKDDKKLINFFKQKMDHNNTHDNTIRDNKKVIEVDVEGGIACDVAGICRD
jgi:hypothetical protein